MLLAGEALGPGLYAEEEITPQVLEVELTQPSLFLTTDAGAAVRLAAAVRARLS